MLKTKCILFNREDSDGIRISVMSRHTLNDGKTPDYRISTSSYDLWLPIFSPPIKLLGDYYKRNLIWESFQDFYRQYLYSPEMQKEIKMLAENSLKTDITLLCIEESPEKCHRRILAEVCKEYKPSLDLKIS